MTEDQLEQETLTWLQDVGYTHLYGPDIAHDGPQPERSHYRQVLLPFRLREGIREIPATPYMLHLLAALPRRNEWVFFSPTSATAEKHYTVRPLELLRVHHERIEAWILEQAGIAFDPKVAPSGLRAVA